MLTVREKASKKPQPARAMDSNLLPVGSKVKMPPSRVKDAEKAAKLLDAVLLTLSWQQQLVCAAMDTLRPHVRASKAKGPQPGKESQ